MKAVIIFEKGGLPKYVDFPEPVVQNAGEQIMLVKAAAIKRIDKSVASGKHYSAGDGISRAKVIGGDGVGILDGGVRVYTVGFGGMVAEKAVIEKSRTVLLPDGIDDITAAALPNAVIGSAMALRFRAEMKHGETVLINGATGFTGKMAVQIAKHYGAKKVIVTGRNEQSLKSLLALGADEIVSLKQEEEDFLAKIKQVHSNSPIDIIIDYLWGRTAELILSALKGKGSFTHKTRFVSVGAVTGDIISLSAEVLRSVNLQLTGSGLGSWTKDEVQKLFSEILPEMFQLAAEGKLVVDTISVNIKDIGILWEMDAPVGKRFVVKI